MGLKSFCHVKPQGMDTAYSLRYVRFAVPFEALSPQGRKAWLRSLRDFGPSAVLPQDQNTPLREHPVPLLLQTKPFLDRDGAG